MAVEGQHEKREFQETTGSEKMYTYLLLNTFLKIHLALENCVLKADVRKIPYSKCTTLPGGMILMSREWRASMGGLGKLIQCMLELILKRQSS